MTESNVKFCGHTLSHSAHTVGDGSGNQCPGFIVGIGLLPRPTTHAQFMTPAEQGEPTYAELQEINTYLLAALEGMQTAKGCFDTCRWEYSGRHHGTCIEATYAIAKAKGATP